MAPLVHLQTCIYYCSITSACCTGYLYSGTSNTVSFNVLSVQREVYVGDVKEVNVTSIDEVLSLLKFGESKS